MGLLAANHVHSLEIESTISEGIISGRGYRTITQKAELKHLGFSANQLIVPTVPRQRNPEYE